MAKLMLGRCPSCYYNFRSLFCAMTCAPDHSRFLTVKDLGNSTAPPGRITVESIYYDIADDFAGRLLDSCRLVFLSIFCFFYLRFFCLKRCSISRWKSTFTGYNVWSTI
jgi:Niemann-Pick C1 protein